MMQDTWSVRYASLAASPTTLLGYRGLNRPDWVVNRPNGQPWDGCYFAATVDHAKGYIDLESGTASVFTTTLRQNLQIVVAVGAGYADPNISQDEKARRLREAVAGHIQLGSAPLIEALGAAGYGYVGPDADNLRELIIAWTNIDQRVNPTPFRYYRRQRYEFTGWSTSPNGPWLTTPEPPSPTAPFQTL